MRALPVVVVVVVVAAVDAVVAAAAAAAGDGVVVVGANVDAGARRGLVSCAHALLVHKKTR
jgi:hypothetical protein